MLTLEKLRETIELMKEHEISEPYFLRIDPSMVEIAYELGLAPYCVLDDKTVLEVRMGTMTKGQGEVKKYR